MEYTHTTDPVHEEEDQLQPSFAANERKKYPSDDETMARGENTHSFFMIMEGDHLLKMAEEEEDHLSRWKEITSRGKEKRQEAAPEEVLLLLFLLLVISSVSNSDPDHHLWV